MGKKILIIEDEDALSSVLASTFSRAGFEAMISNDGENGLKKIAQWQPDLILLDIVMPKMNGYEVLENLQKNKNKIPVIIISNSGQKVELEKVSKLGAVDWIIKTELDAKEVMVKVKKYLDGLSGRQAPKEEAAASAPEEGSGAKILLVEDDSFLRDICFKKLRQEGFNVKVAVDGEKARETIDQFAPDLVLLDIILPTIDGFEVLAQIRANKNKAISQVPVIMLTNLGQEEDVKKAMAMGADDYLVKANYTTEEIVKKVKSKLK